MSATRSLSYIATRLSAGSIGFPFGAWRGPLGTLVPRTALPTHFLKPISTGSLHSCQGLAASPHPLLQGLGAATPLRNRWRWGQSVVSLPDTFTAGRSRVLPNAPIARRFSSTPGHHGPLRMLWKMLPFAWKVGVVGVPSLMLALLVQAPVVAAIILAPVGYWIYRVIRTFRNANRDLSQLLGKKPHTSTESVHSFAEFMRDVPVDRMLKDLLQITDFSALDPARSQVSQALQDRIHRQAIDSIRQAVAYDRELQLIVKATSADQLRFDRPDFLKSMDQYTSVSRGVSQRHHVIELGFDLGNMHGAPDDVVANAFVAAVIDDQVTLKRIMVTCLSSTQVTTVPIQPHSGESNGNVSNNVIEATWRQVDNKD